VGALRHPAGDFLSDSYLLPLIVTCYSIRLSILLLWSLMYVFDVLCDSDPLSMYELPFNFYYDLCMNLL
jgi:hypothetical protein